MKKVLFSLLTIAVAGSVFMLATSGTGKQGKYTPRSEQTQKSKQGINGAVDYLKSVRNNQTTETLDSKWALTARNQADALNSTKTGNALNLSWSELGPDNIGGRTRAILIDKNNPQIMYAGGVSGGLWKSTTGGSSWTALNDFAENIAIASIAQSANGTIYVGTGEGLGTNGAEGTTNGGTAFIGKGIYKSTDGITFTLIPSTEPTIDNTQNTAWAFVNKLACDPTNPNRIYAATNRGLKSSDDGGDTWIIPVKQTNGSDNVAEATDVDVATDGTVITSVGNRCYVSPNGDDNTFICQSISTTAGDLPVSGVIRVEFAIAPSDPNYMYASVAKTDGSLYNIYKSTDKGDNWTVIGPGGSDLFQPLGTQGWFDNTIAVYPDNKDKIIVGGLDMWEWHLGGTWTQKSLWYLSSYSAYFLHADHHIYVFHPTNPDILFVGSDGGVSRSIDGGETFQTMNIGYNTIQCYAMAASPTGMIMAGCQDNGTLYLPRIGTFPKHASNIVGGDGGWPIFSYINPEAYFATTYYAGTRRSPDMGANFYPSDMSATASNRFFSDRMYTLGTPGSTFPASFVTPMVMWESFNDTYSSDSIEFTPAQVANEKIGKGLNNQTIFTKTLERDGQTNAEIVPGSLHIVCGSLQADDNGMGGFTGNINTSGTNTIDYETGVINIEFSSAPPAGQSILASYNTRFSSGSSILVASGNKPATFWYTTPVALEAGDIVMIQDIVQAHFYLGCNNSIWMTKHALDFSTTPQWHKIATITTSAGQNTQCMTLSKDGNNLFVGTNNGKLFRLSNLRAAQDSVTSEVGPTSVINFSQLTIPSNGRCVTSISIDQSEPNKMIVTLGNYGNTDYVYYTSNALDSTVTFTSKQGNLPAMPVFTSIIPIFADNTVIIGTEYGVYSTEDITATSPQWTAENTGLANVPVYMLWQQIHNYGNVTNYGTIYAATHGRGVFECTKYTHVNDNVPGTGTEPYTPLSLSIYPNPVSDVATISYSLPENSNVTVNVYDLSGKLLKSYDVANLTKGSHIYKLDCSQLRNGTYFIQMQCGEEIATTKLVKMQ